MLKEIRNIITSQFMTNKTQDEYRKYNKNNAIFLGQFANGGNTISEEEALQIPTVNAAVELISSTIANLPLQLFKEEDSKNIEELSKDNRVRLLNNEPNRVINGYNFKKQIVQDYLLHGGAYIAMLGTGNKKESLHILDARHVSVNKYLKNGFIIDAEIVYQHPDSEEVNKFEIHELIMALKNSEDGLTGEGLLETGNEILRIARNEMEYSKNLLENGALPMSVLETATKLTPAAANNLRESFNNLYSGSKNALKTMILEEGLQYKPMSLKPNELELTNSKDSTRADIARLFNIPESMIDAEANKYASNEQNNIHFLQYCIKPIISSFENALNKSMLLESEKQQGYYFKFDTSGILQTTREEKIKATKAGLEAGIYTMNEARRSLDLPDITTSDYYSRSLGDIFIDVTTGKMLIPNLGKAIDPNNLEQTMLSDDEVEEFQKNKIDNDTDTSE